MPSADLMNWRASMDDLKSKDKESQDQAFLSLTEMTKDLDQG
jgi:hypothetical protein